MSLYEDLPIKLIEYICHNMIKISKYQAKKITKEVIVKCDEKLLLALHEIMNDDIYNTREKNAISFISGMYYGFLYGQMNQKEWTP